MAVANTAVLLGANALLMRLRTGKPHVDAVLFILLRLCLITAAILATGLTAVMTSTGLGILGAGALCLLLAFGERLDFRGWAWPRVGVPLQILLVLVILRLILQVWFFAPFVGDVPSYHLPKVGEWTRARAITAETGTDWRAPFPGGFELIEVWWVVFLHHDVLIEMAGVEFLILAFAAVNALSREIGLGERASILAAAFYALTPGLHLQSVACLNDGAIAALVVSSMALVVARAHPALIVMAAGVGVGVKPTYAYAAPGILLLFWLWRKNPLASRPPGGILVPLTLVGMASGSYWYVRNWALYGNPIYPMGPHGMINPLGYTSQQLGPTLGSLLESLRRLMDRRIYDPMPQNVQLEMISGWGIGAFAFALPALLIGLREDGRLRQLAVGFGISMISVLLLVRSDMWYMRFVLFFPAILSIAAARMADSVRILRWVAGAALSVQFLSTIVPGEMPVGGVSSLLRQSWRERRMDLLPWGQEGNEPVACLEGVKKTYLLYRPDFSRRVIYVRPKSGEELLEILNRQGIRVVQAAPSPMLKGLLEREKLKPIQGQFYRRP
jgi:hypothetical protein